MRGPVQQVVPMTHIVKRLIIVNVAVWVVLLLIIQKFLSAPYFYDWLGFIPIRFFQDFWLWQPFTYMFLHSDNVIHLLFNMLLLWWLGAELEIHWGRRYFLFYYMACGVGAAFLYLFAVLIYYVVSGDVMPLKAPVVGASGAIFGLIVAYGLTFGERIMYFLMVFPMKAKHFVMIIGVVELVTLMSQGFSSQVANLAHLGGLVTGYFLLKAGPRLKEYILRRKTRAHGRKLKLVVDNEASGPSKGPRYWN
jgi:membrane associated rhomboid family serine protease